MKRFIPSLPVLFLTGALGAWAAAPAPTAEPTTIPTTVPTTAPAPVTNANASLEATFAALTGKVTILNIKGRSRKAKMTSTVPEGSTVTTAKDATASLKLFDGSTLDIKPDSSVVVTGLQKPSLTDKMLKFKLVFGQLFATVRKLASSKSSFEVEAGGVVCGVRGTEFSVFYDPVTGKVDVVVTEGTVWTTADGKNHDFHGGQQGTFLNGTWTFPPPPSTGNTGLGFIASNPFYGFNGTGSDDFNNPLTDLPGGINGITGEIGGNGPALVDNQHILGLLLGFPQYLPVP